MNIEHNSNTTYKGYITPYKSYIVKTQYPQFLHCAIIETLNLQPTSFYHRIHKTA